MWRGARPTGWARGDRRLVEVEGRAGHFDAVGQRGASLFLGKVASSRIDHICMPSGRWSRVTASTVGEEGGPSSSRIHCHATTTLSSWFARRCLRGTKASGGYLSVLRLVSVAILAQGSESSACSWNSITRSLELGACAAAMAGFFPRASWAARRRAVVRDGQSSPPSLLRDRAHQRFEVIRRVCSEGCRFRVLLFFAFDVYFAFGWRTSSRGCSVSVSLGCGDVGLGTLTMRGFAGGWRWVRCWLAHEQHSIAACVWPQRPQLV